MTISKHPSKQNIKIAIDNCIFTVKDNELYILLIQMKKVPYNNMWALPGGLVKDSENLDKAAMRILKEETNVANIYLEQLYTFGETDRDPRGRVISVAYFALIPDTNLKLKTIPKYADVKWHKFVDLPKLAYDHNEIAKYAKQRLEWKIEYSNAVWSLLPTKFTLSQLQKVYESILGQELDKRNFRKKIFKLNIIQATGEKTIFGAHRPAMLYKFKSTKPQIVKVL
ncbi:NUDIX domain-containing protein [Patescibacteria group bacterium]